MRKIFLSLIISTTTFLPFYTQAEQISPICNSSPHELTDYFSSITSVLNQLDINSTTNSSSWFWALWEKIAQTWVWSITLFMTFWIDGFLHNIFPSFKIIFHEPYVVRDWVKLINFKKYITQTFLKAASKWILKEKIPSQTLEKIKATIKSNPYFLHEPEFQTYQQFFKYIRTNQQDIESLYLLIIPRIVNKPSITTTFPINQQHLADIAKKFNKYLDSNYKEYQCDIDLQKTIEKIKEVIKLSKKSKWAVDRFECNYQRLKNVLFESEIKKECKSYGAVQLAQTVDKRISTSIHIQNKKELKEIRNLIKSAIRKLFAKSAQTKNNPKETKQEKTKEKEEKKIVEFSSYQEDLFISEIEKLTKKMQIQKHNWSTALISVDPVFANLTPQFPTLSEKIWIWICTIDTEYPWCNDLPSNTKNKLTSNTKNKSSQKEIYQNLVETCENQSPFIWRCRYLGF